MKSLRCWANQQSHTTPHPPHCTVSAVLVPFNKHVWAIEVSDLHECALLSCYCIFCVCIVTVLFWCRYLFLYSNQLSGSIPSSLSTLTGLQWVPTGVSEFMSAPQLQLDAWTSRTTPILSHSVFRKFTCVDVNDLYFMQCGIFLRILLHELLHPSRRLSVVISVQLLFPLSCCCNVPCVPMKSFRCWANQQSHTRWYCVCCTCTIQ